MLAVSLILSACDSQNPAAVSIEDVGSPQEAPPPVKQPLSASEIANINFRSIGYYSVSQGVPQLLFWPKSRPPENPDEYLLLSADSEFFCVGIDPTAKLGFSVPPHLAGYSFTYSSADHQEQTRWPILFSPIPGTDPVVYRLELLGPIEPLISGSLKYDYCKLSLPSEEAFYFRFDTPAAREEIEMQIERIRFALSSDRPWPCEAASSAFLVFSSGKKTGEATFSEFDPRSGSFVLTIEDATAPNQTARFDGTWTGGRQLNLTQRNDSSKWSLVFRDGKLFGVKVGGVSLSSLTIDISDTPANGPIDRPANRP
jgi:hypothetical protein